MEAPLRRSMRIRSVRSCQSPASSKTGVALGVDYSVNNRAWQAIV
jgi:hypothetical protein